MTGFVIGVGLTWIIVVVVLALGYDAIARAWDKEERR
jgi:hypothetical protein